MSKIDIVLAVVILIGAYRGYRQGFLMEIITFLAIVLGILGGFKLLGQAMLMLDNNFKINGSVLPYVAFAVVFIIIVIAVSLLGRFIKSSIDKSFLGRIDQAMGAFIGIFKLLFVVSVGIWIIGSLSVTFPESWTDESWLFPFVAGFAPTLVSWIGEIIPVFRNILDR